MTAACIACGSLVLAVGYLAYRDMRREVFEIASNVLLPASTLPRRCVRWVLRLQFRVRDLLLTMLLAALACAVLRYAGPIGLITLPGFGLIWLVVCRPGLRSD